MGLHTAGALFSRYCARRYTESHNPEMQLTELQGEATLSGTSPDRKSGVLSYVRQQGEVHSCRVKLWISVAAYLQGSTARIRPSLGKTLSAKSGKKGLRCLHTVSYKEASDEETVK